MAREAVFTAIIPVIVLSIKISKTKKKVVKMIDIL